MLALPQPRHRRRRGDDLQRVRPGARGENPDTGELYQPEDLNVIDYNEVGTAMLQDAIFARASWLEDGNEDVASASCAPASAAGCTAATTRRLHRVHGQRRLDAGHRPPDVDDERDQRR
jgi:hypothetical protein